MKKIIVTLAVLLLAAPAMATVTITCTPGPGPNDVTVSFTSDEGQLVRAIALDIQVNDPNAWVEDVNCVNASYYIYPGSISINASGDVTDYGTCAGVIDGNLMTSEQGSLYAGADPLPTPGDLFIVTFGGCTLEDPNIVSVTVSENVLRGGIVMEDPDVGPTSVVMNGTSFEIGACFIEEVGCLTCLGDLNGDGWLSPTDLSLLFNTLGPIGSPYWVETTADDCGDMNQDGWLSPTDLSLLFNTLGPVGSPYWVECP